MPQRYFLPTLPAIGRLMLDGDLAHHLGRVRRVRPGEALLLGDGAGGTALARVEAVQRDGVLVQVETVTHEPPPRLRIHVAFAPPKMQRAEWLFEHGTEVGIAVFQPLWTARTRPQGERTERWHRIACAAASQCNRAWLPEVRSSCELVTFLASDLPAARFLAQPAAPPLSDLAPRTGEVLLLVGPEGGFTSEEATAAGAAGFVATGLGPHTLRTETAALVGAALLHAS